MRVRKRTRKTVRVCYFMDLFACGFETRDCAPQTVSPLRRISSHEITQTLPMFCSFLFLTRIIICIKYIKNKNEVPRLILPD